jgi:hypothetical protein
MPRRMIEGGEQVEQGFQPQLTLDEFLLLEV